MIRSVRVGRKKEIEVAAEAHFGLKFQGQPGGCFIPFAGEDLDFKARAKAQQQQQEAWILEQLTLKQREKEEAERQDRYAFCF